jgi:hypothetical protein
MIGPIVAANYANQQMASAASEQTAAQNKFDLQNLAAAAIANDKDKNIQEVRPAEETSETNEDAERKKREEEEREKNKKNSQNKENKLPPLHKLDIKV